MAAAARPSGRRDACWSPRRIISGLWPRQHVRADRARLPRHLRGVEHGEFLAGQLDDAGRRARLHLRGHARAGRCRSRSLPRFSLCAAFGLVVERALVRPFAARGSNAWLMATVAGGIVLDNAVLFTFGKEPRSFPPMLSTAAGRRSSAPASIRCSSSFPWSARHRRRARPVRCGAPARGKALLAVVQNPDAARLMGIDVDAAIAAVVRAVDRARRPRRHPDRAAVQRAFRHGHAVRHQGLRGRDPRRHHLAPGA